MAVATHTIAAKQNRSARMAQSKQSEEAGEVTLVVGDEGPVKVPPLHIYNILPLVHEVNQPPNFPRFKIGACEAGKKFWHTTFPALVKNPFNKPGTNEHYYIPEDGRKSATSLLNPSVHPASPWETQLQELPPGTPGLATDQFGSNLNAYGCFWSVTPPDDPSLEDELELFKMRVERTMKALVDQAESLYAANDRRSISPRMHFAMDYLGLSAPWHQSTARMTPCPNCGMQIREGLSYHKNEFGERCILNWEKAFEAGVVTKEQVPEQKRWWNAVQKTADAGTSAETESVLQEVPSGQSRKGRASSEKP